MEVSGALLSDIVRWTPSWCYYGTLFPSRAHGRRVLRQLFEALPDARRFYDINLREGHWNLPLVERLCHLASILKLNEQEARTLAKLSGISVSEYSLTTFCEVWAKGFDIDTICVTLGEAGCYVYSGDEECNVPGYSTIVEDTVGAGDAFAAATVSSLLNAAVLYRKVSGSDSEKAALAGTDISSSAGKLAIHFAASDTDFNSLLKSQLFQSMVR